MQLNQYNFDLFIISAANVERTEEDNNARHGALKAQLKLQNIVFSDCEGQFEGVKEKSLIVEGARKMVVHHYASVYGQHSFLRLEPHRGNMYRAVLIDTETGKGENIGFFRSVPEDMVHRFKLDYTKDENGTYYTVLPSDGDVPELRGVSPDLYVKLENGGKEL